MICLNSRFVRVEDGKANPSEHTHSSYLQLDISFMCFTSISPQVRADIKQVLLRIGGCRPSAEPMPTMLQSVILSPAPILTDRRCIARQSLQWDIKQRYMSQSILEWGRLWSSRWRRIPGFCTGSVRWWLYPVDLMTWGPRSVHSFELGVVYFTLSSYFLGVNMSFYGNKSSYLQRIVNKSPIRSSLYNLSVMHHFLQKYFPQLVNVGNIVQNTPCQITLGFYTYNQNLFCPTTVHINLQTNTEGDMNDSLILE